MLFLVCLFVIYLVLDLLEDYGYIKNKAWLWHTTDAVSRVLIFSMFLVLCFYPNWVLIVENLIISLYLYWVLFDLGLNLLRQENPLYVGSTSAMDKLQRKFAQWISLKIVPKFRNTEDNIFFLGLGIKVLVLVVIVLIF